MHGIIPTYGGVKSPPPKPRGVSVANSTKTLDRIRKMQEELKQISNTKITEESVVGGQEHLIADTKLMSEHELSRLKQLSNIAMSDSLGDKLRSLVCESETLPASSGLEPVAKLSSLATSLLEIEPSKRELFADAFKFAEYIIDTSRKFNQSFSEQNKHLQTAEHKLRQISHSDATDIDLDKAVVGYEDVAKEHERTIANLGEDVALKLERRNKTISDISAQLEELCTNQISLEEAVEKRNSSIVEYSVFNVRSALFFEGTGPAKKKRDCEKLLSFISNFRSLSEEFQKKKLQLLKAVSSDTSTELKVLKTKNPSVASEADRLTSSLMGLDTQVFDSGRGGVFRSV